MLSFAEIASTASPKPFASSQVSFAAEPVSRESGLPCGSAPHRLSNIHSKRRTSRRRNGLRRPDSVHDPQELSVVRRRHRRRPRFSFRASFSDRALFTARPLHAGIALVALRPLDAPARRSFPAAQRGLVLLVCRVRPFHPECPARRARLWSPFAPSLPSAPLSSASAIRFSHVCPSAQ